MSGIVPKRDPKPKKEGKTSGIYLDEELLKRLDKLASETNQSRSAVMRFLIEEGLKRHYGETEEPK